LLKNLELLEKLCPASQSSQLSAEPNNYEDNPTPMEEDISSPDERPCSTDELPPQLVEAAVSESEQSDAGDSEEWPEGEVPPLGDANPVEGEPAA
jgi:hypothetical protein